MVNLIEKLVKSSANTTELKRELGVLEEKLAKLLKNYPIELSPEEANAISGGLGIFGGASSYSSDSSISSFEDFSEAPRISRSLL